MIDFVGVVWAWSTLSNLLAYPNGSRFPLGQRGSDNRLWTVVLMVYNNMVKIVNIVRAQSQATSMPAPQSQRWSLRPILDLDSDKFQCFNHRRRTRQHHTASECQVSCGMARSVRTMYSTRLALFIHGIMSAKRTRELRPVVFVGESSARLLMYSLDIQASDTHVLQVSERLH